MIKAKVSNIPMLVFMEVTKKAPEKVNNKILKWKRKWLKKVLKFD